MPSPSELESDRANSDVQPALTVHICPHCGSRLESEKPLMVPVTEFVRVGPRVEPDTDEYVEKT